MVIFHSYVKLPDGNIFGSTQNVNVDQPKDLYRVTPIFRIFVRTCSSSLRPKGDWVSRVSHMPAQATLLMALCTLFVASWWRNRRTAGEKPQCDLEMMVSIGGSWGILIET